LLFDFFFDHLHLNYDVLKMANFRVAEANSFRFGLQEQDVTADVRLAMSSGETAEESSHSKTDNALKVPVSKKNNSKKTRMPSNYVPPKTAVICGRGKACTSNPGNRKLRSLIKEYLESYGKANNKVEKTEIVTSIMDSIKKDCGDEAAFVKKEEGVWWEVDDAFAREKIGCIFRDSLFTKYRSSTKAKLARRKQQVNDEEQLQQQQQKFNAAFGGMGGMDLAASFGGGSSFMPFGMGGGSAANNPAKQLSQMLSFQGDLGSNIGMDPFLKQQQQQQQQLGLFSASDNFMAQQHTSHRRELLRHAPSMMGLPGGNQTSYMEPSMALGEAFDLLQNLQPSRNQTSQLLGELHQQQKRETYFKDLLGVAFGPPPPSHQSPPPVASVACKESASRVPAEQQSRPTKSSGSTKHKSSRRKRRGGKSDNDDLESLPDDISGIFD
jgi:hypothetical protein